MNKYQKKIVDEYKSKSTVNISIEKNLGKVKPQHQIIFENLYIKHKGGWWRNKPFKSLGNIIHWLYVYGTLGIAEICTVGDGYVKYYEFTMKFKFTDEYPHIPYFYDLDNDKYDFILENQMYYLDGLNKFPTFVVETQERYNEVKKMFK